MAGDCNEENSCPEVLKPWLLYRFDWRLSLAQQQAARQQAAVQEEKVRQERLRIFHSDPCKAFFGEFFYRPQVQPIIPTITRSASINPPGIFADHVEEPNALIHYRLTQNSFETSDEQDFVDYGEVGMPMQIDDEAIFSLVSEAGHVEEMEEDIEDNGDKELDSIASSYFKI